MRGRKRSIHSRSRQALMFRRRSHTQLFHLKRIKAPHSQPLPTQNARQPPPLLPPQPGKLDGQILQCFHPHAPRCVQPPHERIRYRDLLGDRPQRRLRLLRLPRELGREFHPSVFSREIGGRGAVFGIVSSHHVVDQFRGDFAGEISLLDGDDSRGGGIGGLGQDAGLVTAMTGFRLEDGMEERFGRGGVGGIEEPLGGCADRFGERLAQGISPSLVVGSSDGPASAATPRDEGVRYFVVFDGTGIMMNAEAIQQSVKIGRQPLQGPSLVRGHFDRAPNGRILRRPRRRIAQQRLQGPYALFHVSNQTLYRFAAALPVEIVVRAASTGQAGSGDVQGAASIPSVEIVEEGGVHETRRGFFRWRLFLGWRRWFLGMASIVAVVLVQVVVVTVTVTVTVMVTVILVVVVLVLVLILVRIFVLGRVLPPTPTILLPLGRRRRIARGMAAIPTSVIGGVFGSAFR
mmetsp:Transcript_23067/g.48440  ORF Transcript_23067/g.48440 Transcript_23067/m.48440 type:complete len:461 (+) Transcript_23067:1540-2922(+)